MADNLQINEGDGAPVRTTEIDGAHIQHVLVSRPDGAVELEVNANGSINVVSQPYDNSAFYDHTSLSDELSHPLAASDFDLRDTDAHALEILSLGRTSILLVSTLDQDLALSLSMVGEHGGAVQFVEKTLPAGESCVFAPTSGGAGADSQFYPVEALNGPYYAYRIEWQAVVAPTAGTLTVEIQRK
jgi:hypothetical protein